MTEWVKHEFSWLDDSGYQHVVTVIEPTILLAEKRVREVAMQFGWKPKDHNHDSRR
jgi:hypothetical protein